LKPITLVRVLLFAAAATPAAALVFGFYQLYYGGDFDALTANPGDYITDQTGTWALGTLAASLSVTPIRRLTGWNEIIKARRMLGLFAFFYATVHLLIYVVLDQGLAFKFILADIAKRPYITAGMTAFALMLPLAITSTRGWIRRLGRRWQLLHRLVYVSAIAACLHFLWKVKVAIGEPVYYAAILAVLLLFRLAWWGRKRVRTANSPPVPAR
jgi:sulfoxide reductase heme-binding subunit YedZ